MGDIGDHASRAHAAWSASASERLWACPGSLILNAGQDDKESEAAAWGTAAHEVAEYALRNPDQDYSGYPHKTVKTKRHEIAVDDEVVECAQVYVDYVRERAAGKTLLVEQKFSLAAINPPMEAGGTGDAVILDPGAGHIEIVDLKGGRGIVVEASGNKQLRTYALGAILANPGPWKQVTVTIVQPRAPHPDGRIRSETFHVADLIEWTGDLLKAMAEARQASIFAQPYSDLPEETSWSALYLKAGTHCTFCKAAATCPALASRALEAAKVHFQPEGAISTPPDPSSLTVAQIVRVLDAADMIGNWLNAVRAHAQEQAEMGVEITDGNSTYVLTPKRATRKWKDEDPVMDLALATGRETSDFYQEPKLMSPAQVEKLLGKKGYEAVKELVTQESSGLNLVRSDKTVRGAVAAPAKQFFQPEGGQ